MRRSEKKIEKFGDWMHAKCLFTDSKEIQRMMPLILSTFMV